MPSAEGIGDVHEMLDRHKRLILGGDFLSVTKDFRFPLTIYSASGYEVQYQPDAFAEGLFAFRSISRWRGATNVAYRILSTEPCTGGRRTVEVHWSYSDREGAEKAFVSLRYFIAETSKGTPRIDMLEVIETDIPSPVTSDVSGRLN